MTIKEKFGRLGIDNAPGQEALQKSQVLELRGEPIPGPAVDFSHGEVDAHKPTPGSFEVFAKGYLSTANKFLTPAEKDSLVTGAYLMTLECGVRFLADYLNGDVYFKIHRENHNLDRCRTQFKLVADMEAKEAELRAIVNSIE